jgi:putative addiction module killer protein
MVYRYTLVSMSHICDNHFVIEVRHYLTADGKDPIAKWLRGLKDHKAKIAIERRLNRVMEGNFGDHKQLQESLWELRFDLGPGYRVYFTKEGNLIVILLCGGDKSTQDRDIATAARYLEDWRGRSDERQES